MTQQLILPPHALDSHAVGIVKALQREGYTSYLVGGCVRDLLIGLKPKDFDIGTSAPPEKVRRIIYRSYVIGKRFRLVLVKRDEHQYEVATFRREVSPEELQSMTDAGDEVPTGDNFYGSPEEDARRRDFTINALFYDPVAGLLIDTCGGMDDLRDRVIRIIGEPVTRLREDPIRILRGVRLAHKLGFSIDSELRAAMMVTASTLAKTVLPRRREEILKILRLDDPSLTFLDLFDLGILHVMLPTLVPLFEDHDRQVTFLHYLRHMHDTPLDPANPVELYNAFLLAVLRARYHGEDEAQAHSRNVLDQPELQNLIRDELGMFKYENALCAKALHLQPIMKRKAEFEKRGPRRRQAIVMTDAFRLALQLAQRDYLLSSQEIQFWENEARQVQNLVADDSRRSHGPKRRRRRRSTSKRTSGANIEKRVE